MSHQDGLGNNRPETTGLSKPDDGDDRMEKKSENVAHARDGIKPKNLKNSGRLRNSPWTGGLFDGTPCRQSVTPGNDTWRTRDVPNRAAGNLVRGHNGDIESPRAIGTLQGNDRRPPHQQIVVGTVGGSSGKPDAASAHATNGGLLNQADKQEAARDW